MRPVFESNELKPMVATAYVDDPIAFWKKASADGTGRDVLAAMLNVAVVRLCARGARHRTRCMCGPISPRPILPNSRRRRRSSFTASSPPSLALAMKKAGKYSYYRLGISPNGVWHYFLQ